MFHCRVLPSDCFAGAMYFSVTQKRKKKALKIPFEFYGSKTGLRELDSETLTRIRNGYYQENYNKLRLSALFILVGQIVFIIRDLAADFYRANSLNYLNLAAEVLLGLFSLFFLFYTSWQHVQWDENRVSRVMYNLFMAIVPFSVCAFTFTDMVVRHSVFGVCTCFLFIPIVAPYFDLTRQTILFAVTTVFSAVLFLVCFPDDRLGVIGVILLPLLLYLTSCFMRSYFIKTLIYRENMQRLNDELVYRSKTDFLTDVSSRLCLYEDFLDARSEGKSIGLALYDIDDFKKYNDTFSHLAGDSCLQKPAMRSSFLPKQTAEKSTVTAVRNLWSCLPVLPGICSWRWFPRLTKPFTN